MKSKILELARIRKKQGHSVFLYPDHKLPMTRREFLSAGLIDSAVFIAMPTLLDLALSRTAQGAEVPPTTVFVCFDSQGGAGHHQRDFMPMTSTGGMPDSTAQARMGITPGTQQTTKYGAAMAMGGRLVTALTTPAPTGGMEFAPPPASTTPSKIQFATFSATTRDDNSGGSQSPMGLIAAYLNEKNKESLYVQAGINVGGGANRATVGTNTGGVIAKTRADGWLAVTAPTSVTNAISGPYKFLTGPQAIAALETANRMADNRRGRVNNSSPSMNLLNAQKSGMSANLVNAKEAGALRIQPRTDAFPQGLHPSTIAILDATGNGLSAAEKSNLETGLLSAVRGISRPMITFVKGGGDYHNGNTTAEAAFVQAKSTVVKAISNEVLMRAQTSGKDMKVVSAYITDGGMVCANTGTAGLPFNADEGRFSRQYVSVASMNGVAPKAGKAQLGFADQTTGFAVPGAFGDNSAILSVALFASMITAAGEANWLQMVRKIVPETVIGGLSDDQLRSMNAFA